MKSEMLGRDTLEVEVSHISQHGIWLLLSDREVFLPYNEFPWFRNAPVCAVLNVQLPQSHHLYWPDLDIDLAVESIEYPEKYPLVSQVQSKRLQRKEVGRSSKKRASRRS